MRAKTALDSVSPIIHGTLTCGNIRTVNEPGSPADAQQGSTLAACFSRRQLGRNVMTPSSPRASAVSSANPSESPVNL